MMRFAPLLLLFCLLLSPSVDYRGVRIEDALEPYGDGRPLLIVVGDGDSYAHDSAQLLADQFTHPDGRLVILEIPSHGTTLLKRVPDSAETVIAWLDGIFDPN